MSEKVDPLLNKKRMKSRAEADALKVEWLRQLQSKPDNHIWSLSKLGYGEYFDEFEQFEIQEKNQKGFKMEG
ncbi:hypothetical protein [Piscirickettsia litoralis]|uniref:Uncharacterized protein n=1 Tax=Piscirickettsia litoralis TaxID=1891921 RepID=A0ABX3A0U0_9GAMM|nr:hypothetical protein [Piscirickettsia litoralis]ODN41301.1 hypothetical protein BGC07_17205 [Piscirickettsia litoralis]